MRKSILDSITEEKREIVSQKLEIIRPILVFEKAKSGDVKAICEFQEVYKEYLVEDKTIDKVTQGELIDCISKKYGKSTRTIKRYLAEYKKAENEDFKWGEEGLIPRSGEEYKFRKDNKQIIINHPRRPDTVLGVVNTRLDDKYIPIIKGVIEKEFLTLKNISYSQTYDSISALCVKDKLKVPKPITIRKMLDRIEPQIKARMRLGAKAARSFDDVERGFTDEALFPLHIIEIDHKLLDIQVIDDKTGFVIGRPWVTMGIDLFSRCVWCFHISFEEPSINKVRKALLNGLLPKKAKQVYKTRKDWDVFGVPTIIYLDNGPEFKSSEVRRMIEDVMESHVIYRPVKTPQYGATIERLFGTLDSQLIHSLDGTTKSNIQDLGEYNAEKEAILTLDDLKELLSVYITDIYHYKEHKGLPDDSNIPILRYYEGLNTSGFPDYVLDVEKIYMELLPFEMKPYTRDGITFNNRIYKSQDLIDNIGNRDKKYKVKYDPDDISRVFLYHPITQEYVEVRAVKPSYDELKGMNEYTFKKLKEIRKEIGQKKAKLILDSHDISEAKAELRERTEKKYKANKSIRKLAKRAGIPVTVAEPETIKSDSSQLSLEEIIKKASKKERK
ncbi:transposase [Clostridium sp. P21]|uniref:Transposase n=1 Tax=Clostridium muellerianum TaxID=2716538 RepID=A0A7Y0HLS0_9CLOT|nr:Mu transposase C-terminal domain-containing protein [Clostridium muellerianum]NMM62234.1 transposase [Clostridium muellerianum]